MASAGPASRGPAPVEVLSDSALLIAHLRDAAAAEAKRQHGDAAALWARSAEVASRLYKATLISALSSLMQSSSLQLQSTGDELRPAERKRLRREAWAVAAGVLPFLEGRMDERKNTLLPGNASVTEVQYFCKFLKVQRQHIRPPEGFLKPASFAVGYAAACVAARCVLLRLYGAPRFAMKRRVAERGQALVLRVLDWLPVAAKRMDGRFLGEELLFGATLMETLRLPVDGDPFLAQLLALWSSPKMMSVRRARDLLFHDVAPSDDTNIVVAPAAPPPRLNPAAPAWSRGWPAPRHRRGRSCPLIMTSKARS